MYYDDLTLHKLIYRDIFGETTQSRGACFSAGRGLRALVAEELRDALKAPFRLSGRR